MVYDSSISFEENLKNGPSFDGKIPIFHRPLKNKVRLFGYEINGPLGIPACPLTTSKGIKYFSQLGYDVFTYKTISTRNRIAHGKPNIGYVVASHDEKVVADGESSKVLGLVNSIGNACLDPEWHHKDIQKSRNHLSKGQLLIVSIYGTGPSEQAMIEDFVHAAELAQSAGAQAIECNLSCPNVTSGPLYQNASFLLVLGTYLTKKISLPLIAKVGLFDNENLLKESLLAIARSGFQAICTVNTIKKVVVDGKNDEFFPGRSHAGISGALIFDAALRQLCLINKIKDIHQLNLHILATGGITSANQFDLFFDAGATIAMSATGTMLNHYLAYHYYERKHNEVQLPINNHDVSSWQL